MLKNISNPESDIQLQVQASVLEGLAQGLQNKKSTPISEAEQTKLIHVFFETQAINVRKSVLHLIKAMDLKNEKLVSIARKVNC